MKDLNMLWEIQEG